MAIKVMADSGGTITYNAAEIGGAFNTFAGGSDYIIEGIGSEMALTYSASSLEVSIAPGRAVICGRPVTVDSAEQLQIDPSQTNVLVVLRIDFMEASIGEEGYFTYCTEAQLKTDNINAAPGYHDLIIGQITTDSSGVTSFVDQRNITAVSGGPRIRVIRDEDGNLLQTPIVFEIVGAKES